jgi:hypothetical protein
VTQHFLGVRVRHILGFSAREVGGYMKTAAQHLLKIETVTAHSFLPF